MSCVSVVLRTKIESWDKDRTFSDLHHKGIEHLLQNLHFWLLMLARYSWNTRVLRNTILGSSRQFLLRWPAHWFPVTLKKKARCHLNGLYCKEALNSGHVISLKREREELYLSPRRCDIIVCITCDNALWHFLNGGYGYCEWAVSHALIQPIFIEGLPVPGTAVGHEAKEISNTWLGEMYYTT